MPLREGMQCLAAQILLKGGFDNDAMITAPATRDLVSERTEIGTAAICHAHDARYFRAGNLDRTCRSSTASPVRILSPPSLAKITKRAFRRRFGRLTGSGRA